MNPLPTKPIPSRLVIGEEYDAGAGRSMVASAVVPRGVGPGPPVGDDVPPVLHLGGLVRDPVDVPRPGALLRRDGHRQRLQHDALGGDRRPFSGGDDRGPLLRGAKGAGGSPPRRGGDAGGGGASDRAAGAVL